MGCAVIQKASNAPPLTLTLSPGEREPTLANWLTTILPLPPGERGEGE